MATASDYPVTFGYGAQDGLYYGSSGIVGRYHRGNDRPTPIGTPIVIGQYTIGHTGSTGLVSGPHLHTQAMHPNTNIDTHPALYEFKFGQVVDAGWHNQFGNYIKIRTNGIDLTYAHLSKINVSVGEIILGDCLEVMRGFDDECIDLTVTSPPYDNLRTYGGYSFDFEPIARELYRVTKDGGVVVWVVGDQTIKGSETGTSFKQTLYFKECGFNLHDTMIYAKKNPIPLTHNRYEQAFEYMFVLSKNKPAIANIKIEQKLHKSAIPGNFYKKASDVKTTKHNNKQASQSKLRTNIWTYTVGHNYFDHPAVFPLQLVKDHIISWSDESDTILDPFLGSGTTAKAAQELNRKYIGIEINPDYVKIAQERLKQEILL